MKMVEARGVEPLSHDKFTGRDYMLSPGRFVGYGMAPELESHCLVRMKFLGRPRAVSACDHACYSVHPT